MLEYIYKGKKQGKTPSWAELRDALGVKSNQAIQDFLNALERKNFIKREKNRARAIVLEKKAIKFLEPDEYVEKSIQQHFNFDLGTSFESKDGETDETGEILDTRFKTTNIRKKSKVNELETSGSNFLLNENNNKGLEVVQNTLFDNLVEELPVENDVTSINSVYFIEKVIYVIQDSKGQMVNKWDNWGNNSKDFKIFSHLNLKLSIKELLVRFFPNVFSN